MKEREHNFKHMVDIRAEEVILQYKGRADRMDKLLGEEPGQGWIKARLEQFEEVIQIVEDQFTEFSDGMLELLNTMTTTRVEFKARSKEIQHAEKEQEIGELCILLSVVILCSSMSLILSSIKQKGDSSFGGKIDGDHETGGGE